MAITAEEKAKLGYQMAITMITYEGQLIWRAFAAMIACNGFILAIGGVLSRIPNVRQQWVLPYLGWILCVCWALVLSRQFGYYAYWFACARAIEKEHLAPVVTTVSLGSQLSKGNTVSLGKTEEFQLDWFARLFKVKWMMYAVISIFVFLYYLLSIL